MIPNVAKRGKSFKGAYAYYGHDKRESWEKQRTTTERVAWTSVLNLATNDPKLAISIMAATALDKDRLKEEAGIKRGGRQSKGDVYAYSLSWHPDEKATLTKEEMLKAANQSMQALGIEDYQAVIVAHNDEPHPHLHIVVNMVNPENGKNFSVSNDYRKLEAWAYDYRKARGEHKKYCPERHAKMEAIAKKKNGEKVPYVRAKKSVPPSLHSNASKAGLDVKDPSVRTLVTTQARENADLVNQGKQLKVAQRDRQRALSDNYTKQRQDMKEAHRLEKKAAKERVIEYYTAIFEQLEKQHTLAKDKFDKQEAVMIAQSIGAHNGFADIFNMFGTKELRKKELLRTQAVTLKNLQQKKNSEIKRAEEKLRDNYQQRKGLAREAFLSEYIALVDQQGQTKAEQQSYWRDRGVNEETAINAFKSQGEIIQVNERLLREAFNDPSYHGSNEAA